MSPRKTMAKFALTSVQSFVLIMPDGNLVAEVNIYKLHFVSYMNDMKPKPKDAHEERIMMRLDYLDTFLEDWKKEPKGFLTRDQIDFLGRLANKTVYREQLTAAQRQTKSEIHKNLGHAVRDINRMIRHGFVGSSSEWDPWQLDDGKHELPYKMEKWKEDVPVEALVEIIFSFVGMYGDEYAIPIAKAIEDGLRKREQFEKHEIEVPVIRRYSEPSPFR